MKELPNKSGTRKTVEMIASGITSSIPVAGGLLGLALFEALNISYNRRMHEFLEDLATHVEDLINASDSLDISNLAADASFQEAIYQATKAAALTTSEQKREQLRNAVIHSIGVGPTDLDLNNVLIRYIQELSPSHMALLVLLDNPRKFYQDHDIPWTEVQMGGLSHLIQKAFPEWESEVAKLFGRDLHARGLIDTDNFNVTMTGSGLMASRTTQFGKSLLALVQSP